MLFWAWRQRAWRQIKNNENTWGVFGYIVVYERAQDLATPPEKSLQKEFWDPRPQFYLVWLQVLQTTSRPESTADPDVMWIDSQSELRLCLQFDCVHWQSWSSTPVDVVNVSFIRFCCPTELFVLHVSQTRAPSSSSPTTATALIFRPERCWRTKSSQETCASSTTEAFWGKKKNEKAICTRRRLQEKTFLFTDELSLRPVLTWGRSSASFILPLRLSRHSLLLKPLLSIKEVHYGSTECWIYIKCCGKSSGFRFE